MARFVIVLPLMPLAAGDEFTVSNWPLHVTLVEPFATEHPAGLVADAVRAATTGTAVVRAAAGEDAMFGRRRDVPVTLVRDGGELAALRRRTLDALHRAGIDTGRLRADFRPHVTRKHHGRLHPGDRVTLDTVAVIDMRPPEGSHHRRVLDAWRLDAASDPASAPQR
ncbi:2'-5' RNA ligase family protein [Agromyces humatus]|uniref:2'-5' RNA ligase family protein n=1 Tax=Agromyces humatus TaxID=279573 RepID=A0ABN2K7S3_9MICO|nr:2'-5' RNA ligase family protein [Agromyces humatus]